MPKLIDHHQRREEIAEAAWRVIRRDGVGSASVRAVAAEAGISTGSLRHVFHNQSELLVFAMELVVSRASARIEALRPRSTIRATVEAVTLELLPLDADRRAEMEVFTALFNAANADDSLKPSRAKTHQVMRDACRWLIDQLAQGSVLAPELVPEVEARRLHALIDGLATHLLAEPASADTAWASEVLTAHFDSLEARNLGSDGSPLNAWGTL